MWLTVSTLLHITIYAPALVSAPGPSLLFQITKGPLVLYRSPECIGYTESEQAWKYMTICCISFQPCRRIKVNPVSSLNKFGSTRAPNVVYQVSRSSASWFRRIFLKVFTIYGPGCHFGHMSYLPYKLTNEPSASIRAPSTIQNLKSEMTHTWSNAFSFSIRVDSTVKINLHGISNPSATCEYLVTCT